MELKFKTDVNSPGSKAIKLIAGRNVSVMPPISSVPSVYHFPLNIVTLNKTSFSGQLSDGSG